MTKLIEKTEEEILDFLKNINYDLEVDLKKYERKLIRHLKKMVEIRYFTLYQKN